MSVVDVDIQATLPGLAAADVRRVIEETLGVEQADLRLSVAVVDDETIHDVNRRFLGHDYPTDVIAFDLRGEIDDGLDGEIVVSVTTASHEAKSRDHGEVEELLFYCVHGTLHLLGYEDHEPERRARMLARQVEIMQSSGYLIEE